MCYKDPVNIRGRLFLPSTIFDFFVIGVAAFVVAWFEVSWILSARVPDFSELVDLWTLGASPGMIAGECLFAAVWATLLETIRSF